MKKEYLVLFNILFAVALFSGCASSGKGEDSASPEEDFLTDPYLDVKYTNVKDVMDMEGSVEIVLDGKTGTFGINAVDFQKKAVPVLSTGDSGSSSYFTIRKGKKEFKLDLKSGITPSCRKTQDGSQFAYTVMNTAQVVLDFKIQSSAPDHGKDMVKVTVYVTNLASKSDVFSCKALFDTVLGEGLKRHFVTKNTRSITGEKQFTDFTRERWIESGNGNTAVQFILSGSGIDEPECVTVANRDFLLRSNWIPTAVDSRSFNSVMSLNNSALCINWPEFSLAPKETKAIVFYVAVGVDGADPEGNAFLASLGDEEPVPVSPAKASVKEEKKEVTVKPAAADDDEIIISPDDITEEQLDSEYIQDLLNRIDSFVAEDKDDEVELKRLNAELDAILEKLGMN